MPKKYRLLKDLPGCPNGTVFEQDVCHSDRYYPLRPNGEREVWSHVGYLNEGLMVDLEWFAPIPDEPERPYPWEPRPGEIYSTLDIAMKGVITVTSYRDEIDKSLSKVGMVYRTEEDADLRLKLEPLVNRALQALLNKKGWQPEDGCPVAYIYFEDGEVHVGSYDAGRYDAGRGVDAQDFASQEDARAITDLIKFFLP